MSIRLRDRKMTQDEVENLLSGFLAHHFGCLQKQSISWCDLRDWIELIGEWNVTEAELRSLLELSHSH